MELCIEGLSKTYPNGVRALDNVTLEVPQGMFGLLGPNGAGKSTLMNAIGGFAPAEGVVEMLGTDVSGARHRVGTSRRHRHPHREGPTP